MADASNLAGSGALCNAQFCMAALRRQAAVVLFLDDVAVVQVEGLSVACLPVEIVLKFAPFAKIAAAAAAMDLSVLRGIGGDVHTDRPTRLAIKFMVELLGVHQWLVLLPAHVYRPAHSPSSNRGHTFY